MVGSGSRRAGGRRWKRLAVELLIFACAIVNLELYCYYRLHLEQMESSNPHVVRNPYTGFRLKPHHTMTIAGYAAATNADGLRDADVDGPPADGEIRILCVGGSQTFGWAVGDADVWCRQLEATLRRLVAAGTTVRVINGGQAGYATANGMGLVEELYDAYRPTIVVAMFGFNDYHGSLYRPHRRTPWLGTASRWLQHSATYRYLCWRVLSAEPRSDAEPFVAQSAATPLWIQKTVDNLDRFRQMAAERGFHLLFCVEASRRSTSDLMATQQQSKALNEGNASGRAWPPETEYALLEQSCESYGNSSGLPMLLMNRVLARSGLSDDRLFQQQSPVHTTIEGHRLEGAAIAFELVRLGWIPSAQPAVATSSSGAPTIGTPTSGTQTAPAPTVPSSQPGANAGIPTEPFPASLSHADFHGTSDVTTNADGFRDAAPPSPRRPGELRVLCLGDSQAFGVALASSQTWPAQLAARLSLSRKDVTVINAGLPGTSARKAVERLRKVVDAYDPQIVVASFGYDDVHDHGVHGGNSTGPWYEDSAANMRQMADVVKRRGGRFVFVAQGVRENSAVVSRADWAELEKAYAKAAKETGCPLVLASHAFAGMSPDQIFRDPTDTHLTPGACRALAEAIAQAI